MNTNAIEITQTVIAIIVLNADDTHSNRFGIFFYEMNFASSFFSVMLLMYFAVY